MKNKKLLFIIPIVILLILVLFSYTYFEKEVNEISYKVFSEEVENNNIDKVIIYKDNIEFLKKNDETLYQTVNPGKDSLKEELLLKEINIEDKSSDDVIETCFNVIIICMYGVIFYTAISVYLKNTSKAFKLVKHTHVKFDDIAGMDSLKKEMMTVVDILKNQKEYKDKGIRQTKGIILEGPPGNGKTLFAKALAEEAKVNFIAAKGADFQSAMMSMGSRKIKTLFKIARRHRPCIIFIDEFDSIGERRNYTGTGVDKENNRIITSMLNEMDGFDSESGILVIAATNSYHSLDAALIRPGRFDLKYTISNPDKETRYKLIELYTKKKKLASEVNVNNLCESFDGLSASAIETILNEAVTLTILENRAEINNMDIINASQKTGCAINVKKLLK